MPTLTDPASLWKYAAIGFALVAWALIVAWPWCSAVRRAPTRTAAPREALGWLLPWIVVPTAVIGLYSLLVSPMYSARYLSFAAPAVALLDRPGLAALRRPGGRSTALVLLTVLTVPVYLSQRTLWAKSSSDWVSVAGYVQTHAVAGRRRLLQPALPGDRRPWSARPPAASPSPIPAAFAGLDDLTLTETPVEAGNLTGLSRTLAASRRNWPPRTPCG